MDPGDGQREDEVTESFNKFITKKLIILRNIYNKHKFINQKGEY